MYKKEIFEKLPLRVVVFEDSPAEQTFAGEALAAVGLKCEILSSYDIEAFSDDVSVIAVLTDVFLTDEPQGFGIAAYCAKHSVPCCIVTQQVNHNFSGWQGAILEIWDKLDIKVFSSTTSPKDWESAATYIAEKAHEKLMKTETPIAKAYQRYFFHLSK